jgi:uncharacterized DUF497 family protein
MSAIVHSPVELTPPIYCCYTKQVQIAFDPDKREQTLRERGLDFAQAAEVFAGVHFTQVDRRMDYGEERFITVGTLQGRTVVVVWTSRGLTRRIISMRKANAREQARYKAYLE